MHFALHNKTNNLFLTHPHVGLWYCESRAEAEDMLLACNNYLKSIELDYLVENISIVEVENEETQDKTV